MSDNISTAVRNARSAYQREWRKKNPNKAREYNLRYWERRTMREQLQNKEKSEHGTGNDEN